jgi:hypothetical protein
MVQGVGEKHRFTSKTRGKIRPRAREVSFKLCARMALAQTYIIY